MFKWIKLFKKKLQNWIKPKVSPKGYGLSFDNQIHFTTLPVSLPVHEISFQRLNTDLSVFEVVHVNTESNEVTLLEVCTNNEITLNASAFNLLFSEADVPKEVKF